MDFYVQDFGAIGDGKTLNTCAIQNTIDACYKSGGGRVIVSNGTFMTGTIVLRSNAKNIVFENTDFSSAEEHYAPL